MSRFYRIVHLRLINMLKVQVLQYCQRIGIICNFVCNFVTVIQWEQKAIFSDSPLIFIGVLLLSTVVNIYIDIVVAKCVKPRMIYQALTPYEYREVCVAQARNRRIFLRVSKSHARRQEFEKHSVFCFAILRNTILCKILSSKNSSNFAIFP